MYYIVTRITCNIVYYKNGGKNMGEYTPVSYRLSDDTKQRFKEIAKELGLNQDSTMDTLINAYYLQGQQDGLDEYKANLDDFTACIAHLTTMYTDSLQSVKMAKNSRLEQYQATLDAKDEMIAKLEADLQKEKEARKKAETRAKDFQKQIKELKAEAQQGTTVAELKELVAMMQANILQNKGDNND